MSSINTQTLLEAYKSMGPPPKREGLLRTDEGWYKLDLDIVFPYTRPSSPHSLYGMPVWDFGESARVVAARLRVSRLGKKKPRGRRNKEALRLVRVVAPGVSEISRAIGEAARDSVDAMAYSMLCGV